jgi:tripartite-type tricarboxylate transporter receptor subunit TctC
MTSSSNSPASFRSFTPSGLIRRTLLTFSAVLLLSFGAQAQQQTASDFPSKPITILVPTAPGGALDTIARLIGEEMQKNTGRAVVVDSKPGANGIIAVNRLKQLPADGYTVMLGLSGVVQNLVVQEKAPYKLADFAPITMVAVFNTVLATSANDAGKTLQQVLKERSSRKESFSFGTNGTGSSGHIIGNLLGKAEKVGVMHVPYAGEGAMFIALMRSDVDAAFVSPSGLKPHMAEGKLNAFAVTGSKRLPGYEKVPTFAELGHPDLSELSGWAGLFAVAGTPQPIVDRLYEVFSRAIRSPTVTKKLAEMIYFPDLRSPGEFKAFVNSDLQRWNAAFKRAGPLE